MIRAFGLTVTVFVWLMVCNPETGVCGDPQAADLARWTASLKYLVPVGTAVGSPGQTTAQGAALGATEGSAQGIVGGAESTEFFEIIGSAGAELLSVDDLKRTAKRLEKLSSELEDAPKGSEKGQQLRFNLAYEYLRLYKYYQKAAFDFLVKKANGDRELVDAQPPVSAVELEQYLDWASRYLGVLTPSDAAETGTKAASTVEGAQAAPGPSSDISLAGARSYSVEPKPNEQLRLNVHFLGLIVECEKLATAGMVGDFSQARTHDHGAWLWLDELWGRYRAAAGGSTVVQDDRTIPANRELLALYGLYLRYHLLRRSVDLAEGGTPFLDSVLRVILERLEHLQAAADTKRAGFFERLRTESYIDRGDTGFFPKLFFARLGRASIAYYKAPSARLQLFEFYRALFDGSAGLVKHNVRYRSRIYNELIVTGLDLDNLQLMESVLYPYAMKSMEIAPEQNLSAGAVYKSPYESSDLTASYLISRILSQKMLAGLDSDIRKYREAAIGFASRLVASDNDNWQFAAKIHQSLADFYSHQPGHRDEALAMFHAREALLVACKKIYATYGEGHWQKVLDLPGAATIVKAFTEYKEKYPASPYAIAPEEYSADKVVAEWKNKR